MQIYNRIYAANHGFPRAQWGILLAACRQAGCSPQVTSTLQWQVTGGRYVAPPPIVTLIVMTILTINPMGPVIIATIDVNGIAADIHNHNSTGAAGYAFDLASGHFAGRLKIVGEVWSYYSKALGIQQAVAPNAHIPAPNFACIPAYCWGPMQYHLYNQYLAHTYLPNRSYYSFMSPPTPTQLENSYYNH
jgi:hypothetical protein